ncbi:amidohydrolase family protein [Paenibacillus aurantius]|uniref:Amidohydrolase family protein n=1 Tax=Paenibacillus aurantius TaxID=2918900 RepID=A0AA96RE56_9BACL|nr:amidohydrolase family protein [Paenibacillus aurantius]WNQ10151.1 amidohydrolase family protein [Paenibacillus aurantius]
MRADPFIVDADVHNTLGRLKDLVPYLPKVWHQQWLESGIGVHGQYYSPVGVLRQDAVPDSGGPAGSDPRFVLKHYMEPNAIDFAVLTGGGEQGLSLHADPDYATAVAAAFNDWLADTWLKASPKFKGSIQINHSDPAEAAKEIDRMARHPDMVQVVMGSGARMPYGNRFYHPIYEAAERNGLPVAIHPGTEGKGIAGAPTPSGYPTRYMEWHNILPANFMAHINSLVCEGVFEKYPKLKFVAIEGGISWLPHLMWRMNKNYKALRDTTPWLKRLPSEYILEHVRLTTQPIEEPDKPEHLVQIFEMMQAERIAMFSSDYPHWDFDNPKIVLNGLPREMRRRILGLNAAELYHLPQPEGKGATPVCE